MGNVKANVITHRGMELETVNNGTDSMVPVTAENFEWHKLNCEPEQLTPAELQFVKENNLTNVLYSGDTNLEYGGYFIAPQKHGYAEVIEVVDCANFRKDNGNIIVYGEVSLKVDGGGYQVTNEYGRKVWKRHFTMKEIRAALEYIGYGWKPAKDDGAYGAYEPLKFRELTKKQKDLLIYDALISYWGIGGDGNSDYLPPLEERLKVNKTFNHRCQPRLHKLEALAREFGAELITLRGNEVDTLEGFVLSRVDSIGG